MKSKNLARHGRGGTSPGGVTRSPDEILEWAWAEACSLVACGEDPSKVSLEDVKRRLLRDLLANQPNLMVWTEPRCTLVNTDKLGPFAKLGDGSLLTVGDNETFISRDGGATWSRPRRMCPGTAKSRPSAGGLLIRTRRGHLMYVYMDLRNFRWSWNEKRRAAPKNVRCDVWAVRSEDEGRTWQDPQRVFAGYCGALINMIETTSGELVVPIQRLVRNPCRHAICVYVSADGGKCWVEGRDPIDLGGHGNHDGGFEPAIVQLGDGRLWMLIRTNRDQFWSAYSKDAGRTWPMLRPSGIDASSAPGGMIRLASGRLVLAWNRLHAMGRKSYRRWGGDRQWSLRPASGHREELSIAFSEDEGRTWSPPEVIFRHKDNGAAYPYLFEPAPGQVWVSTLFGYRTALRFAEQDFVGSSRRRREARSPAGSAQNSLTRTGSGR